MDRDFKLSAAPTFGAATGSTKGGNRERKSREITWGTHRRRMQREPAGIRRSTAAGSRGSAREAAARSCASEAAQLLQRLGRRLAGRHAQEAAATYLWGRVGTQAQARGGGGLPRPAMRCGPRWAPRGPAAAERVGSGLGLGPIR
jgi:hypothetical protein